jgi:hypothetical protein
MTSSSFGFNEIAVMPQGMFLPYWWWYLFMSNNNNYIILVNKVAGRKILP